MSKRYRLPEAHTLLQREADTAEMLQQTKYGLGRFKSTKTFWVMVICTYNALPLSIPAVVVQSIHEPVQDIHPHCRCKYTLVKTIAMHILATYFCWRSHHPNYDPD